MVRDDKGLTLLNRDDLKKGAGNLSWLLVGNYVSYALSFLTVVAIARQLGPEKYGSINAAVAYIGLFSALKLPGFDKVFVREAAWHEETEDFYYSRVLGLKLISAFVGVLISLVVLPFLHFTASEKTAIALFSLTLLTQSIAALLGAVFQAHEDMKWMAITNLVRQTSYIVLAVICLYALQIDSIEAIMATLVASYWVGLTLALWAGRRYVQHPLRAAFEWLPRTFMKAGVVFSVQNVIVYMYTKIDVLMARFLISAGGAGIYTVGTTMLDRIQTPFNLTLSAFFPRVVKRLRDASHVDQGLTARAIMLFAGAGVLFALAGTFAGPPVLRFLFGSEFAKAADVFTIVVWSLPFSMGIMPMLTVLQASRREVLPVKLAPIRAAMNIGFNLAFVYAGFGIIGIAWSTVVTSTLYGIIFLLVGFRELRRPVPAAELG